MCAVSGKWSPMHNEFHQTTRADGVQDRRRLIMGVPAILAFLGSLIVAGSISAAPAYPVKKGPTGRYLVDQRGVPFLIARESPQAMIGNLNEAEAELFLAHRAVPRVQYRVDQSAVRDLYRMSL